MLFVVVVGLGFSLTVFVFCFRVRLDFRFGVWLVFGAGFLDRGSLLGV